MFFTAIDGKLFEISCPETNVRLKFVHVLFSVSNSVSTHGIKLTMTFGDLS